MDDFIHSQGVIWLPHIMRRLANRFVDACDQVFPIFGINVPPRSVSCVHWLHTHGPSSVSEIAQAVGQSHPLVNNNLRQLKNLGLVTTAQDQQDRRRTIVTLTTEGRAQATKLLEVRPAFEAAYADLMGKADAPIFDALWRMEQVLTKEPFAEKIMRQAVYVDKR